MDTREGSATNKAPAGLEVHKFFPEDAEDFVADYIDERRDVFFFLESGDWQSEHEYRVLQETDDHTGAPTFLSYGNALRYVILGGEFPEWKVPSAVAVVAGLARDVDRHRMTWSHGYPRSERNNDAALLAR